MIEYLALGLLGWLLLSLPFAVLIGKCISVGQAGETARHAADAAGLETTAGPLQRDSISADDQPASTALGTPALPAQRQPIVPARRVS